MHASHCCLRAIHIRAQVQWYAFFSGRSLPARKKLTASPSCPRGLFCLAVFCQHSTASAEVCKDCMSWYVETILGYIRISPAQKWSKTHWSRVKEVFHTDRNPAGICATISTSPLVRKIKSVKLSRFLKPEARFFTILRMRLTPSPTALVSGRSMKVIMLA